MLGNAMSWATLAKLPDPAIYLRDVPAEVRAFESGNLAPQASQSALSCLHLSQKYDDGYG